MPGSATADSSGRQCCTGTRPGSRISMPSKNERIFSGGRALVEFAVVAYTADVAATSGAGPVEACVKTR